MDKLDTKMSRDVEKTPSIIEGTTEKFAINIDQARKDKALALLNAEHVDFDPNSPEAKAVLRKIDLRIVPMVLSVYVMMLVDKNSLSFANIMGIKQSAGVSAGQYSWLGVIVYFGYLAGEIPVTFFMQRLALARFFSIMVIVWGGIVCFHSACTNFAGLMVVRFLLGMIELCTAPIVIIILGSWYTKEEQVSRVAIWYTASGWGAVFGGFFAWCIYQADTFRWQGLFLFEGLLTAAMGMVLLSFLAASPTDARWLSDREKVIALERCRANRTGTEVWAFNKAQLIEAFCDIRFYIIFLLLVSTGLPNGGITVFGPAIIAQFGFTPDHTTLLSMAPGGAAVVGTLLSLIVAKYTNRTFAGVFLLVIACVGVIMMLALPPERYLARYGGYILTMQFPICVVFVIAFMTAGVGGYTKKLAFGASYQLGYTVGNIIGPQTYRSSDAPDYYTAKYTMLAFLIFTMILIGVMGLIHWSWNKKRDKQDALDAQNGVVHIAIENEEFADLTDFQIRSFRYPV